MKTLTEKRFFEWHEDDVSVTLRNKSGSYGGGGAKYSLSALYRRKRQMKKKMEKAFGFDWQEERNIGGGRRMPDKEHFNAVTNKTVVRRLTPLECTRLQGFPDGWVDIGDWYDSKGKLHKDSDTPKYKALGNSIALPFWEWMAKRMAAYLKDGTMASLFDGIGGFPLAFKRAGIKPVWASEIEEFPIAVTKARFPDDE